MTKSELRTRWSVTLESVDRTRSLAGAVAEAAVSPGTIAFFGGLGSGKTTFIQALGRHLGCGGFITSPTYTIINSYECSPLPLVHVDCYRVEDESELYEIGLDEILNSQAIVCLEWSEKAGGLLPADRLEVHLDSLGRQGRLADLRVMGDIWPELYNTVNGWLGKEI